MSKSNLISLTLQIFALTALLIDYFFTSEFDVEGIFFVSVSVLLILNITLMFRNNMDAVRWISAVANLLIISLAVFIFWALALNLFGYGYTGSEIPVIWIVSFIANSGMLIAAIMELVKTFKRSRENKSVLKTR